MKSVSLISSLFVALASVTLTEALVCPTPTQIAPCTCTPDEITCEGSTMTQDTLTNLFSSLRTANSLTPTDWLSIPNFYVSETDLTSLDLTPFFKTKFEQLIIYGNPSLTTITSPSLQGNEGSIDALDLYLPQNALTDHGLTDTLRYFVSSSLVFLYLSDNKISGGLNDIGDGSGDIEFLPGLSALNNLEVLDLKNNLVTSLTGGQFKRNGRLTKLYLSNNGMTSLGADALLFNEESGINFRYIYLGNNQLIDSTINPETGLSARSLENQVNLNSNGFEFISQQNFQSFLDANEKNSLNLSGNKFICDEKMKWLKDGIDKYQYRVTSVDCTNDPGHTIFTTELV